MGNFNNSCNSTAQTKIWIPSFAQIARHGKKPVMETMGAMGTHEDPMRTNGRAMRTQGDPMGTMGGDKSFFS